jgi:hypothetical protein
MFELGILVQLS